MLARTVADTVVHMKAYLRMYEDFWPDVFRSPIGFLAGLFDPFGGLSDTPGYYMGITVRHDWESLKMHRPVFAYGAWLLKAALLAIPTLWLGNVMVGL